MLPLPTRRGMLTLLYHPCFAVLPFTQSPSLGDASCYCGGRVEECRGGLAFRTVRQEVLFVIFLNVEEVSKHNTKKQNLSL